MSQIDNKELENRMLERDIRPTAVRLLVLREMLLTNQAYSLLDLETKLDTVDKSTLYRTIVHFHEQLLIHSIDDGSGSIKYSVCKRGCDCSLRASHVHFSCDLCKRTFCLEQIAIPKVELPLGFEYDSANFVFKGTCDRCTKNATKLH